MGQHRRIGDWRHYLPVLARKPGAVPFAAALRQGDLQGEGLVPGEPLAGAGAGDVEEAAFFFAGAAGEERAVTDTVRTYVLDTSVLLSVPRALLRSPVSSLADQDSEMIYVGAGAGAIGIVGSALFFLLGRRRQDNEAQAA